MEIFIYVYYLLFCDIFYPIEIYQFFLILVVFIVVY